MKWARFPDRIRALEPYSDRFEAFRLAAKGCQVLFGAYPAGTRIEPHAHDTDNWGVITCGEMTIALGAVERRYGPGDWYHVPAKAEHSAWCERYTEEIEFWFEPDGTPRTTHEDLQQRD
jgi:quercetin dioxygenase-like cupin family protein